MSSVPVSQYEALRAEMRSLVQQAQQVQEIASQVISTTSASSTSTTSTSHHIRKDGSELSIKPQSLDVTMESLVLENAHVNKPPNNIHYEEIVSAEGDTNASEDECGRVSSAQMSVSSEPITHPNRPINSLYHGTWPVERTMWNSEPTKMNPDNPHNQNLQDQTSVLSFASSSGGVPLDRVLGSPEHLSRRSMQQLEAKVDMVYSLLAMLGGQEHADMGDTLLALSTSPESCLAMRQSGCIPLLVQLVQSDKDLDTRKKASQALHNLVDAQPDERLRRRETRVLKLLEHSRAYTEALKNNTDYEADISSSTENQENPDDKHPVSIIANLMKHSFDEGHRQAICQLGGIHIIASLVETEHTLHGSTMDTPTCVLLRRYACMALTNLTFGDSGNKALLCSFREFMRALVIQLQSSSDELRQVTASVLRNLSWRADQNSKEILREVGTVAGLMKAGMATSKENTLKSILSALWNLSAHCTENKLEICAVEAGLGFLVEMLSYKAPSQSLTINENAGGILRNISSQIAVRDDYREVLRKHNCLQILLEQLKSPSLTIVSNACGTLWNLSAKNQADQEALWQMGAPAMLRSLNHSKHKMIATGSSAALKNLLNSRPSHSLLPQMDSTARAMDLPALPTLGARKQKALLQDLDQSLSETYENIERDSPTKLSREEKLLFNRTEKFPGGFLHKKTKSSKHVVRSESHEFSTHTELVYESRKTRSEASNQNDLCNGFSSLNLNEPSTSYQKELRSNISSSLVYANQSQRKGTFIPVRSNFTDNYSDDIDSSDQPIDYSRKYAETKLPNASKSFVPSSKKEQENCSLQQNFQFESSTNKLPKENVTNYGIYAETDLDQPTDYSLRYAEDDSDSDICDKIKDGNEYVQDTIKTYCTEGTPYETPVNFSTATSMSDLRIDSEKNDIDNDKNKDKESKNAKVTTLSHLDEKDHCSVEDISDIDNRPKSNEKVLPSVLSSGLMSPEKPINYCEEGTPGYFSRVSSFGSLNSIPVNDTVTKGEEQVEKQLPVATGEASDKNKEEKNDASPSEAKAVKFVEPAVNYAEQTPLMFSRSSSLASLDSVEQHSIHDDRSSVISDFSRLNSGIVSPSELPDSPTQTVPPSPRPRKVPMEYPSTSRNNYMRSAESRPPQPAPRSLQKASVFEDNITKFKEESTPIQFSTATSISSLTIDDQDEPICGDFKVTNTSNASVGITDEGSEKQDTEQEKRDSSSEFNEQLSENDEDDDILADCINIGMQNNRHRQTKPSSPPISKIPSSSNYKPVHRAQGSGIPLPRTGIPSRSISKVQPKVAVHLDMTHTYCTEDTPAVLSHAGSNSDLSVLSMQTENKSRKDYLSDDSSNLSGDNDNILAECIQSGMPKAKAPKEKRQIPCSSRTLQTSTPIKPFNRNEMAGFGNEDKKHLPSYLGARDEIANFAVENSPCQFSLRSSLSDLTTDGSVAGLARTLGEGETDANSVRQNYACALQKSNNAGPSSIHNTSTNHDSNSRRESLSSLSVESFGSIETEQALLEQCISSGMPKSKHNVTPNKPQDKPIGVATKQFNSHKTIEQDQCRRMEKENDRLTSPKNVSAASVAGNTNPTSPDIPKTVTGGDNVERVDLALKVSPSREAGTYPDISLVKSSHTEENLLTDLTKSGCEKSLGKFLENSMSNSSYSNSDNCLTLDKSDLETVDLEPKLGSSIVDNRMLDPDAMIESLDRFTAELVSQASSHLQNKEENKYSASITEGDTWNEDISPNDVTFPSISGSVPNVVTFESEKCSNYVDQVDGMVEQKSNDFSSINTSTMTESTLIAMEATKMATTFQQEADLSNSITNVASLELDQIQPPSNMNSLTSSAFELVKKSPKSQRKRSLPVGLMVRRALSNSLNQATSVESLENHSVSNLDQVNPPSAMMGDMLDMDGSMISVASISSDIGEFHLNGKVGEKFQQPNPIFNVKQPVNMLHILTDSSNLSDLDNVNPPSLFNEITDMCNSLADIATENIETEIFEDCNTFLHTDNDITEFSDANSATPIQSDLSSAESTPKKQKTISKQLTPKQKRKLGKERYQTYTIAAEMVMREEEQKHNEAVDELTMTEDYRTVADTTETYGTVAEKFSTATFTRSPSKVSPKERRLNDRARFQTQVVDKKVAESIRADAPSNNVEVLNNNSPAQSPTRSRISIRKNFVQKRLENKERFKTQTIAETSLSPPPGANTNSNDMHYLVQKEANMVLKTLRETKSRADDLIDCETLSLVSNEDDSEHNSGCSMNYRTYHKSWGLGGNNIPVIQPAPSRVSSDLENYYPDNLINDSEQLTSDHSDSEDEAEITPAKPKIVKPSERVPVPDNTTNEDDGQGKGIRGRRKPLYSKANANNKMPRIKPIKSVSSNLVKNMTSTLKSSSQVKVVAKPVKQIVSKPPIPQTKGLRAPTNYTNKTSSKYNGSNNSSPKGSPVRTPKSSPKHSSETGKATPPSPLERQGTFTKEDKSKSKIPSAIPKAVSTSRIARAIPVPKTMQKGLMKSASSDRANKPPTRVYNRSPSADSREKPKTSPSRNGAVKRSVAEPTPRSSSNSSVASNSSTKITSRIANLWKKVEESKKQPQKKDSRIWIQTRKDDEPSCSDSPRLIRSNTFENKESVLLRQHDEVDETKRLSRLGSFLIVDEDETNDSNNTESF